MLVLLLQLDGKLPNVALMRIAAHHRALGDAVELRRVGNVSLAERLLQIYPKAIVGGTGWDLATKLEDHGITTKATDYSIYPRFAPSIGFLQRGCRLSCSFCVVPRKEGPVVEEQTVAQLWRGPGHARDLLILDNDPFGNPAWRERFAEIRDGGFRACFSQGINARLMDDEGAAALAGLLRSGQLRDDSFAEPRCYTAWDSRPDEDRLFKGLRALVAHGARPRELMVFMLVGYAGKNRPAKPVGPDDLYRVARLREFGAIPYPMPFDRDVRVHLDRPDRKAEEERAVIARGLVGLARWTNGAFDKPIPWGDWERAGYRPENLERTNPEMPLFGGSP